MKERRSKEEIERDKERWRKLKYPDYYDLSREEKINFARDRGEVITTVGLPLFNGNSGIFTHDEVKNTVVHKETWEGPILSITPIIE